MSEHEFNEIEKVIINRRSVRQYRSKKIPEYLLRRVLEAGRFAPSAGNCQPWRFVVVQNSSMIRDMEKSLLDIFEPLRKVVSVKEGWRRNAMVTMVNLFKTQNVGDLRPLGAMNEVLEGRLKIFHNAPAVILVLKDTRGIDSPDFDTGLCCQNMVLAAHSLGLGTCYIGFVEFLEHDKEWMKKLGIHKPWEISTAITIGYPKWPTDGLCQRDLPQVNYYDEEGDCKVFY